MTNSLFMQYVEKYFPNYVSSIVERLNGRSMENQLPFMFRQLLTPSFSADGRWASIVAKYNGIAADIVAMGTETPLKSRDTLSTYVGEIPKIAIKRAMNEIDMKNLDAMIASGRPEADIVNRIFSDVPFCINGIDERIEDLFLSMLSTGVGAASNNIGQAVRFNMNYFAENQKGVTKVWSDPTSRPIDDIVKIIDQAENDGNSIRYAYADNTALNALYNNEQVRGMFGFQMNYVGGGANVPSLSFDQLASMFMTRWGITLRRIQRTTRTEINGVRSTHKAWADGRVVFTCDEVIGDLVYTSTAEENHRIGGVSYTMANDYTLVSKFSTQEPLVEFTKGQAMVVPVINNVDRIYTLDSKVVQG